MTLNFRNLSQNIETVMGILSQSLFGQFRLEDDIINPEAQMVLRNPDDRIAVDEAVDDLKRNREKKNVKVTLSDKREITLSVD